MDRTTRSETETTASNFKAAFLFANFEVDKKDTQSAEFSQLLQNSEVVKVLTGTMPEVTQLGIIRAPVSDKPGIVSAIYKQICVLFAPFGFSHLTNACEAVYESPQFCFIFLKKLNNERSHATIAGVVQKLRSWPTCKFLGTLVFGKMYKMETRNFEASFSECIAFCHSTLNCCSAILVGDQCHYATNGDQCANLKDCANVKSCKGMLFTQTLAPETSITLSARNYADGDVSGVKRYEVARHSTRMHSMKNAALNLFNGTPHAGSANTVRGGINSILGEVTQQCSSFCTRSPSCGAYEVRLAWFWTNFANFENDRAVIYQGMTSIPVDCVLYDDDQPLKFIAAKGFSLCRRFESACDIPSSVIYFRDRQ